MLLFCQGLRPNSILLTLICDRWIIRKVIKFDRLFLLVMELYRQKYSNRNIYLYCVLRAAFYWYRPSVRTIYILHTLSFDRSLAEEVKRRMKLCDCKWRELTICQGNVFEKATAFEKKVIGNSGKTKIPARSSHSDMFFKSVSLSRTWNRTWCLISVNLEAGNNFTKEIPL